MNKFLLYDLFIALLNYICNGILMEWIIFFKEVGWLRRYYIYIWGINWVCYYRILNFYMLFILRVCLLRFVTICYGVFRQCLKFKYSFLFFIMICYGLLYNILGNLKPIYIFFLITCNFQFLYFDNACATCDY